MRNCLLAIATALFGLLFGLLLAEGLLRLYFAVAPTPPNSTFLPDKSLGYRLRPDPPGVFAKDPDNYTNSLGFRDREHSTSKPPGTYRILGIGDSFVYGRVPHLADHYLKVVEDTLTARLRTDSLRAEMVLMGVPGYSPEQYVALLRSAGLGLHPDLVIMNFYVGNDVTGIPIRGKVFVGKRYFTGSPYPWLDFLRRSDLFMLTEEILLPRFRGALLRLYLHGWKMRRRGAHESPSLPPPPPAAPSQETWSDSYLHGVLKESTVYLKDPDRRTAQLWTEAERYLIQFDKLCADAKVPWVLFLIPTDLQIDQELHQRIVQYFNLDPDAYDFDLPQRRLTAWAHARGITVVDPLESMRALYRPDARLYYYEDGHLNVRGNHVAGAILGAFLADKVLPAR